MGGDNTKQLCARLDLHIEKIDCYLQEFQLQMMPDDAVQADLEFMPHLLAAANQRKPNLNCHFAKSPADCAKQMQDLIAQGVHRARFVVNVDGGAQDQSVHFIALEYAHAAHGGKTSVIGIEPAVATGMRPLQIAGRMQQALNATHLRPTFALLLSDIQRSRSECGIFSLAFAKNMLREARTLGELHDANHAGRLAPPGGVVEAERTDRMLPPSFFKHAQSARRVEAYLLRRPDAQEMPVNKKGESLRDRVNRHMEAWESHDAHPLTISTSIERKRRDEMASARAFLARPRGLESIAEEAEPGDIRDRIGD
jgi:YopJ family protease